MPETAAHEDPRREPRVELPPIRLGQLTLASPVLLAPLAGYTDLAFRLCCREQGGVGLATTEIISAEALRRNARTVPRFLQTVPADTPLAVQLDGGQVEALLDAARIVEDLGFPLVDINMGCPVRRITKKGGGSAWTQSPERAAEAVGRLVDALSIPVTVKTRLGWDETDLSAPDLARALEAVGVSMLTVHGRTRAQGFSGRCDLDGIRRVVEATRRMPVIANGDVTSPEIALETLAQTGARGVAIGRGALADPWIFRDTQALLETGQLPPAPSRAARVALARRHAQLLCEVFDERYGAVRFRKAGVRYSGPLGVGKRYRRAIGFVESLADVARVLDDVEAGRLGNLPPRRATVTVPVPQGPVEKW